MFFFTFEYCINVYANLLISVNKPRVLAVVGMGHVDGIIKYYGKMKQEDIVPLLL